MKQTKIIAVSGVISALSVVFLFMGSVITILGYIMPLVTGLLMIVVVESINRRSAWLIFTAVSIISLFALPDKECALTYIFFFGYYPIIRQQLDKIRSRLLLWLVRLLVFNSGIVLSQLICFYVFGIPFDDFLGKWGIAILLVLANVLYVVYERLLSALFFLYIKKYKSTINRLLKK